MHQDALLLVKGLTRQYPLPNGHRFLALDDVSLEVQPGETLGIVGESGCGKSTLGRLLMGLDTPTAGTVSFQGSEWVSPTRSVPRKARTAMQMVFQDPFSSLNPRHKVGEIVREPLDIHRVGAKSERQEAVGLLMESVGLSRADATKYPHEFSGGQRQRIAIARALALKPSLLVADEPVSALDVSIQSQILNLLMEIRQRSGMAMVFISHDLSVVRHLCKRVAVMYFGKIVETAPTEQLFASPAHPYTRTLLAALPRRRSRTRGVHEGASAAIAELPDPANPPGGCAFAPRCTHKVAICEAVAPVLGKSSTDDSAGSCMVACHLYPKLA